MNAVDAMRVATAAESTAARMESAWQKASLVVRRATLAAVVTSLAVAASWPVDGWTRAGVSLTGAALALSALVDVHEYRLPNGLLALAALATVLGPAGRLDPAMGGRVLLGACIAGLPMLLIRMRRGVGMGDVKMAAVVGASAASLTLAMVVACDRLLFTCVTWSSWL